MYVYTRIMHVHVFNLYGVLYALVVGTCATLYMSCCLSYSLLPTSYMYVHVHVASVHGKHV